MRPDHRHQHLTPTEAGHRDHSSSIFLSSSSSFLLHPLSSQLLSKQSGLGPLSGQAVDMTTLSAVLTATCQTAENVTLGWSETNRLLRRQWERLWLLGHCRWLTDGLKVGPKVGARSEVWADTLPRCPGQQRRQLTQSRPGPRTLAPWLQTWLRRCVSGPLS